ncbi:MAG: hypothetical protein QGG40_01830 [Myxococcota bacterium]|nr:hypothetical protein [Myxococcota bacterium]
MSGGGGVPPERTVTVIAQGSVLSWGAEAEETVDLGVRCREAFYTGEFLTQGIRRALFERLSARLQVEPDSGDSGSVALVEAGSLLADWLDSWPLSALIDDARKRWAQGPDPMALGVLVRVAQLMSRALGWPTVERGPWPLPPSEWVMAQLPGGAGLVVDRGDVRGTGAALQALGEVPVRSDPLALPPVDEVEGALVVERRAELVRALVHGRTRAVRVLPPVPDGPSVQLALGELRLEGEAQWNLERCGDAGLLVGDVPDWQQRLLLPPSGRAARVLRACCTGALLPGTPAGLAQGKASTTGWLLWTGPHAPVAVRPEAIEVLRRFDGKRSTAEIEADLQAPSGAVEAVAAVLVAQGAATAA